MGKASQKLTIVQISQLDDKNCTRYGTGIACEVLVKWHPRERFPQKNLSLRDCELNLIHGIYFDVCVRVCVKVLATRLYDAR